jgi:mRNA-degrading endonuclease toxin of MazEF toxin-antitoxin module
MTPTLNVRAYRPRQVVFAKGKAQKNTRHFVLLSPRQYKQLGLIVVAAVVVGLGLTRFFHGRTVELRAKVDQLQISNTVIADENKSLVAAGAQLASKTQVAALAKRKLNLFEPDQRQVRRL